MTHSSSRRRVRQLAREKALAEQALHSQALALPHVSHEMRTPLNAVSGFAELMELQESDALSERGRGYLRLIRQSAGHLLALVNDILDLTDLRRRRPQFQIEPVAMEPVLREVCALVEPLATQREVALAVEAADAPLMAQADRRRLVQVLINLVANAIKYNRAGGKVLVRATPATDGVDIEIEDSGIGIAPEHLGRLFQPFYRVQPGGKGRDSTGLGLVIAQELTRQMGGDIAVDSQLGHGSTFTLRLRAAATTPLG